MAPSQNRAFNTRQNSIGPAGETSIASQVVRPHQSLSSPGWRVQPGTEIVSVCANRWRPAGGDPASRLSLAENLEVNRPRGADWGPGLSNQFWRGKRAFHAGRKHGELCDRADFANFRPQRKIFQFSQRTLARQRNTPQATSIQPSIACKRCRGKFFSQEKTCSKNSQLLPQRYY